MKKISLLFGILFLASSYVKADGEPVITWTVTVNNDSSNLISVGGTNNVNGIDTGHCWDISPDPGYDNGLWASVALASNSSITKTTKEIPEGGDDDCVMDFGGTKFMDFKINNQILELSADYTQDQTDSEWDVYILNSNGQKDLIASQNMGGSYNMPYLPKVIITYSSTNEINAQIMQVKRY